MSRVVWVAVVGVVAGASVGCGDDAGAGAAGGEAAGGGAGAPSTGGGGQAGGAGGAEAGDGRCASPFDVDLPFSLPMADSSLAFDDTTLACNPDPLPELVFRVVLSEPREVRVTGNDSSGQGVGFQISSETCDGTRAACEWVANGVLDSTVMLAAGTWLFIFERRPAGVFELAVE
jgi:hypothetical protein